MLLGIDHVMLFVNDVERAKGFYRDTLGLGVVHETPDFAMLVAGSQRLGLHLSEIGGGDVGRGPIPYFSVQNVADTVEQLRGRQVHIHSAPRTMPSGEQIATIHDSEGNAIGLVQKR